jgi:hypothetical protein
MFKLPDGLPSLKSSAQEWADYAEILAIKNSSISLYDVKRIPSFISDETDVFGVEDDSDRFIQKTDEISREIQLRQAASNSRYPYKTRSNSYEITLSMGDNYIKTIYIFLLLCTRVKMSTSRIIEDIDGAGLFEHLASLIARNYFGVDADSDVLGTSRENSLHFRNKLKQIFTRIGEGGDVHENNSFMVQDDGVDIVVWKNFRDKNPSKLIAFGQCKTGTSWINQLSELDVDAFCKNWFSRQPVANPIKMFFCAQYFPRDQWYVKATRAGIVFDRFRMMDFLPEEIDPVLFDKISIWCNGALKMFSLS